MSHASTKTIKLTEDELENFRAVAEKFNVKFEIKQVGEYYRVTAPEDKIVQWGYDEEANTGLLSIEKKIISRVK